MAGGRSVWPCMVPAELCEALQHGRSRQHCAGASLQTSSATLCRSTTQGRRSCWRVERRLTVTGEVDSAPRSSRRCRRRSTGRRVMTCRRRRPQRGRTGMTSRLPRLPLPHSPPWWPRWRWRRWWRRYQLLETTAVSPCCRPIHSKTCSITTRPQTLTSLALS